MYSIQFGKTSELPRGTVEEECNFRNRSECFKALLEAGADFEREDKDEEQLSGLWWTLLGEDSVGKRQSKHLFCLANNL